MSETTQESVGAEESNKYGEEMTVNGSDHNYDGLLPEHKEYMNIGPKDCTWGKPDEIAFHVQIQRATNMTGEQMAIQIPVFMQDSLGDMMKRINLGFAIPQKRLEDENKAMLLMKQKQDMALKIRADAEARDKILKAQQKQAEKLEKRGKLHIQGVQ